MFWKKNMAAVFFFFLCVHAFTNAHCVSVYCMCVWVLMLPHSLQVGLLLWGSFHSLRQKTDK